MGLHEELEKGDKTSTINHVQKYMDIAGVLEFSTEVLFTPQVEGRVFTSIRETRNRYCQNYRPSCKTSPTYHCSCLCWLTLQGAYMVLFGGLAISTLYLVLEQLYFKINKSKGGHIKGWSDLLQ